MTRRDGFMVLVLTLVLVGQTGWAVATTSGTYDETTYLRFGRGFYGSLEAEPLAAWGVAPLPVLLTTAVPVLSRTVSYPRAVTFARITAIALFGVPLIVVAYWTLRRACGPAPAAVGTALVALSPNIVAHASLATTDVCFVTASLVVLAVLARHLEAPSRRTIALLTASLAAALAAKYSAIALFVVVGVASFVAPRADGASTRSRAARSAMLTVGAFAVAMLVGWALHAFAMAPYGLPPFEDVRMPASIVGLARQLHHQSLGEPAFLLGRRSVTGWWYYMPAALAMKSTPVELAVFAFACVALTRGWRTAGPQGLVWRIAAAVFGAAAIANRIDLGVRYELILIPLAVFLAIEQWTARARGRRVTIAAGAVVVALQLVSAIAIAPHDLSYFNVFAGGPANGYAKLADSNVDWGQDLPALAVELDRLGARHPLLSYFGTAPIEEYGIRADRWDARVQPPFDRWDWIAISATNLDGVFLDRDPFAAFRPLAPGARAGYSILLYPTRRADVRAAMAAAAALTP